MPAEDHKSGLDCPDSRLNDGVKNSKGTFRIGSGLGTNEVCRSVQHRVKNSSKEWNARLSMRRNSVVGTIFGLKYCQHTLQPRCRSESHAGEDSS